MNKCCYIAVFSVLMSGVCVMDAAYADEEYCREFTQTFTIEGESQEGYGTACLQEDGSWKIVSQKKADTNVEESEVQYVVKEEEVHVVPRVVIFAPGHKWHRKPVRYRHHRWHW